MADDKKIAKALIKQIQERSLKSNSLTLLRLSTVSPSVLALEYRIGELKKFLKGQESSWARTEIEAEKAYRSRCKSKLSYRGREAK